MSPASPRRSPQALQKLLLKRFAMACATYGLVLCLTWVAVLCGLYRAPVRVALISSGLVVLSQVVFLGLFCSGLNRRFRDPSLAEGQMLVALGWLLYLLAHLDIARGTLMIFYALVMLFGVFQLQPRGFVRCAIFAFLTFCGLNLWEAHCLRLPEPGLALLQVCVLFVLLVWLGLFAKYLQDMRQRMRKRRFALQAHQDTLRGMMRQLEDLVATDELTGLFNRRHFLRLAGLAQQTLTPGRRHGLALIDLDHFKRINDAHGHAVGDRVLQTFASVARACLREGDVLARYGGEEFVLLLPDCESDRLAACCERLREAFSRAEPVGARVSDLSLSAGMTLLEAGEPLDAALQRADQALYRAKRGGRNRCDAAWEC